jgi:ubiquinone biosynthesis protein
MRPCITETSRWPRNRQSPCNRRVALDRTSQELRVCPVRGPGDAQIAGAIKRRKRRAGPQTVRATTCQLSSTAIGVTSRDVSALAYVGGTIASIARAVVIVSVAASCVVVYLGGTLRGLAIRDRTARDQNRDRRRGRLLRWSFARLGATFVKIGQVASSRPDLFSAGVIAELRTLQDHVPPFSYRRVRAIIARELGAPIEMRFREFDRAPIAAGSIAQVHRAVLRDGDEVAVKVLRPGVRDCVRRDARLLLWLAHVVHALSSRARAADVIGHTRSLIAGIVAQTELRYEARNYRRFRNEFAGWPAVTFPRVHPRRSTRDVLVMEFVHGETLDRIRPEQAPAVIRALREAFFAMCFDHGLVHADLHPGNVLVRDDGVVALVDVGLVKHFSAAVIDKLIDLARCMAIGDARDLVAHLRKYYRYLATTDWDAVAADATALIADLRRRSMAEIEVSAIVEHLFALARKHRIRPMPELTLVLLGLVTFEGLAKRLEPATNMMAEVAQFLGPRITHRRRLARGSREWRRTSSGVIAIVPEVASSRPADRDGARLHPRRSRPTRVAAGAVAHRDPGPSFAR